MKEEKINKGLYEKLSVQLAEELKNSTTDPRLVDISPVSDFNETIQTMLRVLYDSPDPRARRWASVLNAIYTHANSVFVITHALVAALVEKDFHYPQNSCDYVSYKKMLVFAYENGHLAELRKPVRKTKGVTGKAGLYELISPVYLAPLSDMIGATTLKANKVQRLKWYDDNNTPETQIDASPEIIAERERLRGVMLELRKKRTQT